MSVFFLWYSHLVGFPAPAVMNTAKETITPLVGQLLDKNMLLTLAGCCTTCGKTDDIILVPRGSLKQLFLMC